MARPGRPATTLLLKPRMRRAFLVLVCLVESVHAQTVTWGDMAALREIPDTIALRSPSIVLAGDTIIVAGNHFPSDVDRVASRRRLVIARSPGGMLPIPSGAFDFAFPRIARDARGALHLVWAEFADSSGSLSAWMTPPTSLWHSMFTNGRWSAPKKIFTGRTVSWAGDGRLLVRDSSGNIHIAVPALLPTGAFAVVYLRIDSSGVVAERDFSPGAAYASITRLSGDSLLIVYATADSLTPKGGASTLVRASGDGGRSWAPPVAVARSDRGLTSPPLVEGTSTGLAAFWTEESRDSRGPVLRGFYGRASSATWKEISPSLNLDGMPIRLVSAAARCGSFAIVAELLGGPPNNPTIQLVAVVGSDGRISATRLFRDLEIAMSVGIGADGQRVQLIFSAVRRGERRAIPATAIGRACQTM